MKGNDSLLSRFEQRWRPDWPLEELKKYLPRNAARRPGMLRELAARDLQRRLQAGLHTRTEDYLKVFPELKRMPGALVELAVAEFEVRIWSGGCEASEYQQRFPAVWKALEPRLRKLMEWPTVPGYEILGQLGRGGMGVVYRAREEELKRVVALKMILGGRHASGEDQKRFLQEAQAVARLQHPHIVQIFRTDRHEGLPFLSLEFCPGGSLEKKLRGNPLPADKAAQLVKLLARAVHAAHQKGVIHRDLKPANVLLAENNIPKVTDFGLAKTLGSTGQTQTGAVIGTPSYMAPEQAEGKAKATGPAVDVYGLGAILYELLTGRPPFRGKSAADTLVLVQTAEPVPPRRIERTVPRDLETICLKCLEKKPAARYPTAEALADDLGRYLQGEQILARPVGPLARLWRKTWRRRRAVLAAVLSLVLSLCTLAAVGYATLQRSNADALARALEALAPKPHAWKAAHQANRVEAHLADQERLISEIARISPGDAARARADCLEGLAHLIREDLIPTPYLERTDVNRIKSYIALIQAHDPGKASDLDGQLADRIARWQVPVPDPVRTLLTRPRESLSVPVTVNGDALIRSGCVLDNTVFTRIPCEGNVEFIMRFSSCPPDGLSIRLFTKPWPREPMRACVLFGDGRALITASGRTKGVNRVAAWELGTGNLLETYQEESPGVLHLALSPRGGLLAVAPEVHVDQLPQAGPDAAKHEKTGPLFRGVRLLDPVRLKERYRLDDPGAHPIRCVAFSPDEVILAAGGGPWEKGGEIRLWNLTTRREVACLNGHREVVYCLAFSPDGKTLASGSRDGTVVLWDVATRQAKATLSGHKERVLALAYSPDGGTLVSGGADGVGVWDCARGQRRAWLGHTTWNEAVAFAPGGKTLAAASPNNVTLYDASDWARKTTLPFPEGHFRGVDFSSDGTSLVAAGKRGIACWDLSSERELPILREPGYLFQLTGPAADGGPQAGQTLRHRIVRDGVTLLEEGIKASDVLGRAVSLRAVREGTRLTFQVNTREPLVVRDNLSVTPPPPGWLGLEWPEGVRLWPVSCRWQIPPDRPRALELGDRAWAAGDLDKAIGHYGDQSIRAGRNPDLWHEARYKQALCCVDANRTREAAELFEQLARERGRPASREVGGWPSLAACQLWLLHVRRSEWDASRLVFDSFILDDKEASKTLARLIPEPERASVVAAYGAVAHHVHLAQPRPEHFRNLRRLVAVQDLFGRDHRPTEWSLFRMYRLMGEHDNARRLAERLLAPGTRWAAKDRIHQVRLVEELTWLHRQELRDPKGALDRVNLYLTDRPVEQDDFHLLLLERARIHVARQKPDEARADLEELEAHWRRLPASKRPYRYYAGTYLLKGFLLEERKDRAGAAESWMEGLRNSRTGSFVDDVETELGQLGFIHGWILASLTGQLTPQEAGQLVGKFAKLLPADHPLNRLVSATPGLLTSLVLTPSVIQETWRSRRGREAARRLALQALSFEDYVRTIMVALAAEVLRQGALGDDAVAIREDALWEVAETVCQAQVRGELDGLALLGIARAWQEPETLGNNAVSSLPKTIRGPVAYAFACRCLRRQKADGAGTLFEIARDEAARGSLVGKQAAAECGKLATR